MIRSGYNVIDTTGQVDKSHEAFAGSLSSFSTCSPSYFKKSTLLPMEGRNVLLNHGIGKSLMVIMV